MKNFIFEKRKRVCVIPFFLFLIFSLVLISAATNTQDVTDVFKVNTQVEYAKSCFNNGTYCSDSALCNYTVFEPDNTVIVDNLAGTNQVSFYNISFNVREIGIYKVDMTCTDNGLSGAETFYFEVTGSGLNDTIWFYIIILAVSFGIIILGLRIQDAPIVILGSFGLYFVGLYILFYGIVGVKDLVTTWAIGIIILMLAAYISIKSAAELLEY